MKFFTEEKRFERTMRRLSMVGRLTYLFMCIESYLLTRWPDRDWTPVAERCWQWTEVDWVTGWNIYSVVVPEYLLEFEGYERTNRDGFDGALPESDYRRLTVLYAGLTEGREEDELNRLLMLPIAFGNICEGTDLSYASGETMAVLQEMRRMLSRRGGILERSEIKRRSLVASL